MRTLSLAPAVLLILLSASASRAADRELFQNRGDFIECRSKQLKPARKIRITREAEGYSITADTNEVTTPALKDVPRKARISLASIQIDPEASDGEQPTQLIHADTFRNKAAQGEYDVGVRLMLSLGADLEGDGEFQIDFQNRKTAREEKDQFLFGPTYGTVGEVSCTSNVLFPGVVDE